MNKKIFLSRWLDWTIAIIVIVFIVAWGMVELYAIEQDDASMGDLMYYSVKLHPKNNGIAVNDYKNISYIIAGKQVNLKNGISEVGAAPDSASKITTRYFGNEVKHDFNGDGKEDIAFLLTQETGGSGVFYYVVAALKTAKGYAGSEGVLIGDRIAPQTTEMGKGDIIIVNYADRAPGESFAVRPSVGKSIWLLLDPKTMQFGEVVQNFEGESNL